MRRIRYTIDASFTNAPHVAARYAVLDPATGEEREIDLSFTDDDARAICVMVTNPSPPVDKDGKPLAGEWKVVDVNAPPNLAALDALAATRLAEAASAAATVTARMQQAEAARKALRDAEVGAANARAEEEAAKKRKAELEAEIARLASAASRIVIP